MKYFYDSYAVIEYINNNPKFIEYFEKNSGVLTVMNILEIGYSSLIEAGHEKTEIVLKRLWPLVVQPTQEEVMESIIFRKRNNKRDLSYADCIGYIIAVKRGIKFLTGDIQFKNLPDVEFVK